MALVPLPVGSVLDPDDLSRALTLVHADDDSLPHLGVVGDTYTILLSGKDTNGRFCLIDMYVPPGGGPPPHRHDFEETFVLLEGQLKATFRGEVSIVRAGDTVNVPANAPHHFHNASDAPVRMLCICSPAGNEDLFRAIGVPVSTRTSQPPVMNAAEQNALREQSQALAGTYRTELLEHA